MTDKELRKLSRKELLDMIYQLMQEKQDLQEKLTDAEKRLEDRRILMAEAGSIADAALKINHVFEAAQAAADDFLRSVRDNVNYSAIE